MNAYLKGTLYVIGVILSLAALCWAGSSDYVDSKVVEMKNNGSYERFYSPEKSEAEIVEAYEAYLKERE